MTAYQENEIRKSISGFSSVWQRVSQPPQTETDAALSRRTPTLSELIRDEKLAGASDACLARRLTGQARAVLIRHADAARRRCRRLRAEYFIQEGRCDRSECRTGEIGDCLTALRCAYRRDLETARKYGAAARTDDPELKKLYRAFEQELVTAACEKRALILRLFCR